MSIVLRFSDWVRPRPAMKWSDIYTKLDHFAIVTYLVDPVRIRELLPERLIPEVIYMQGQERALLSIVSFIDRDFYIQFCPYLKFTFPQTNFRVYVLDQLSGERGVWFLGTTLGSYSSVLPRFRWGMPWYFAHYQTEFTLEEDFYKQYWMEARAKWGNFQLHLRQNEKPLVFDGFPDLETALVILTHPFKGYFTKTSGQVGT